MKFREFLSSLGQYLILGIFFLGSILIYVGLGTKNSSFNIYFILIGALILFPFGIYFLILKYREKKRENHNKIKLTELKKNSEKIELDLDKIEIKSNSWTEEIVVNETRYAGLNQLAGMPEKNIETVNYNLHYLKIRIPHRGITYNCDTKINMNEDDLKIKLALKKKTILYVDNNNKNDYYLDLEFLNE